ncbi:hypothetical protein SADUNF_Sadunf10G0126300 [Salix dunnii]|uniref:Uncharacterized protein n=1 Tax=Salix dunnii TaxID=1413687 RepID=A0A835JTW8_9ROSI|nr:hypothetical protein SADUNF_Sadunf10G0126300 [Salix dunnii]
MKMKKILEVDGSSRKRTGFSKEDKVEPIQLFKKLSGSIIAGPSGIAYKDKSTYVVEGVEFVCFSVFELANVSKLSSDNEREKISDNEDEKDTGNGSSRKRTGFSKEDKVEPIQLFKKLSGSIIAGPSGIAYKDKSTYVVEGVEFVCFSDGSSRKRTGFSKEDKVEPIQLFKKLSGTNIAGELFIGCISGV